jgi:hypothetical protein
MRHMRARIHTHIHIYTHKHTHIYTHHTNQTHHTKKLIPKKCEDISEENLKKKLV